MFTDVCRLCLGTNNLLWVFDEKIARNMTDIIHATSGVEILKTDSVSQMVCATCCQITIKMYKFRTTSIKNNLDLKAQCIDYNISQLTNAKKNVNTLRESNKENIPIENVETKESETEPKTANSVDTYENAHPSVKELVRQNPGLKIPKSYSTSDFGARVTLPTNEVEEWFKKRNDDEEREPPTKKMKVSKKHDVEGVFGELAKRSRVFKEFSGKKWRVLSDSEGTARPSIRLGKLRVQRNLSSDDDLSRPPSSAQLGSIEEERVGTPPIASTEAPEETEAAPSSAQPMAAETPPEIHEEDELFTTRPLLRKPRDNEVLIISDSEDQQEVEDTDGRGSDKTPSTEVPESGRTNMPNMSLLSVTGRTHVLYTCKVCDSQRKNRRDLKRHMRKTHTRCPFCSKRFKTLELRNKHVKDECGIDKNPIALKEIELKLTRVDEDEEVRKQYPAAFADPRDVDHHDDEVPKATSTNPLALAPKKNLLPSRQKDKGKPQIKVVDGEVLKYINSRSSDTEVLQTILLNQSRAKAILDGAVTPRCSIEDGSSESEVKQFKNLCKPIYQHNIPIHIRCNPELSVKWVRSEIREPLKKPALWDKMPCRNIKPVPECFRNPPVNYLDPLFYGTSVSTNSPIDLSVKTHSTSPAPLLLNGTQGAPYVSSIKNYIFMRRMIAMAQQSHSSVIKSAISVSQQQPSVGMGATPQTIGNSFMPARQTWNHFVPPNETRPRTEMEQSSVRRQPMIRVKNMNELC